MTDREIIEAFLEKWPGPWTIEGDYVCDATGRHPVRLDCEWRKFLVALVNERCGGKVEAKPERTLGVHYRVQPGRPYDHRDIVVDDDDDGERLVAFLRAAVPAWESEQEARHE